MYVDAEQEESEEVPLVTVRELVRSGMLTDDMMVWTAAFAAWSSLSETRWQFGLAEVMMAEMTIGDDDGAEEDESVDLAAIMLPPPKPHKAYAHKHVKKEKLMDLTKTAALKLSSLCDHAGFLCREELKSETENEPDEHEDGEHELREVFSEFDADGSGQLERAEIMSAMSKALGSVGKEVADSELDQMMKEMDDDGSGDIGFEEFSEWWTAQQAKGSGGTDTKMVKYWAMVVSVNGDGMAVKLVLDGPRAIVFYASKTSLKPTAHVLSGADGTFQLPTPDLSMKMVVRYPHCFGCQPGSEEADALTLIARAAGDRAHWMALLGDRTPFPHKDRVDPKANASEIGRIFHEIDEDGSGVLDRAEVGLLLERMGKKLDGGGLDEIFAVIDADGGGEIELGEFEQWWSTMDDPAATALIRADVGFFDLGQVLSCVRKPLSPCE